MLRFVGLLVMVGCAGSDVDTELPPGSLAAGDACSTTAECGDALYCVAFGDVAAVCTPSCDLQADECSASATCAGIGLLSASVCQEEPQEGESPDPEAAATLPCETDADCDGVEPGSICAEWNGYKDCTIPCDAEADCDLPGGLGFSADFFECAPDEAQTDRTACRPRAECFTNPMNCVSFGF